MNQQLLHRLPLEFALVAPPLLHCSSRWLLTRRPLSLCSVSFSLVMLLLVDFLVNIYHLGHTGTGFSSCSKFDLDQNPGRLLPLCASFNLSSLCFGITLYLSSFCSLLVASYASCILRSAQRRRCSSISLSNVCPQVRSPVLATMSGLVSLCTYLILSSSYLSSFLSRFFASYSSGSLRSARRMLFLSRSRTLCRE